MDENKMNEQENGIQETENTSAGILQSTQEAGNTDAEMLQSTASAVEGTGEPVQSGERETSGTASQVTHQPETVPNGSYGTGYSMHNQNMGGQYNFWQNQSGGGAQNGNPQMNYQYTNQTNAYGNPYGSNMQGRKGKDRKPKKEHKMLKKAGTAALVGIVAGAAFCGVVFGANKLGIVKVPATTESGKNGSISATVTTADSSATTPNDLTAVVNKCMPSIVSINSTITETTNSFFGSYSKDETGSGSGIILKKSEDEILIVTNNHVIEGAKKIAVGFYGTESEEDMVEATVKGTDSTKDLAVVLVKTKDVPEKILSSISAAKIGSSDDMKVGQMVIAIGNALGYGQSMTVGYVSAKDRTVQVDDQNSMQLLQTDAAINPGNSGGALLNADGEVVGINSAKYADTEVEGMGFAIPISDATTVINDLMDREVLKEEEKGYLGVAGSNITSEVQQQYPNMPIGFYVSELSKDGAAEKAGIMVGDVIVGVNGEEIKTGDALAEKVNSYKIGTKITVTVKRYESGKYKKQDIKVTLMAKSDMSISQDTTQGNDSSSNSESDNNSSSGQQTNPYGNSGDQDSMNEFYQYFFGN